MRRPRFKAPPGRSRYGRNRFGGVVWRRDDRAHAQTPTAVTTEDNYYLYDGTNQIKERKRGNLLAGTPPNYTGIDPIQQQENWTYDASGNWTQYSNPSTAAGHTQDREHNDGNELWKIGVSGLGEVWPIYDSMGNMRTLPKAPGVSTDQYTLKWDAWNRLVEVKDGSTVVASYTYDGLNRRLTKTAGSETRHYYYDTQWRTLEERVGTSSTPDRQYTWGLRDRWDLLRRKRSTTGTLDETLYVLRDYLDPVAIADAAGNVVERYAYDAFGNVRFLDPNYGSRSNSSYAWDFLFHGEFRDPETKLYNYGHRYYDTGLGRWLSRDPIGEKGGVNLYRYCGNGAVNGNDYLGLYEVDVHRFLTEFLAGHAGFGETMATRIGIETQALDDPGDPRDAMHGFPGWNPDNMIAYHFPTQRSLASKRRWLFNSKPSGEAGDSYFTDMGQYLHALEDSYSHSTGKDDRNWNYYAFASTNQPNFRGTDSNDPGMGHALEGHKPDWTWLYEEKTMKMAENVYNELKALAEASGQKRHGPTDWRVIEPIIRRFVRYSPETYQDNKIFGTVPVETVTFDGYNKKIKILSPNFELDPILKQNYKDKYVPTWWEYMLIPGPWRRGFYTK
jgi:RHS repeat-associated protein